MSKELIGKRFYPDEEHAFPNSHIMVVTMEGNAITNVGQLEFFTDGQIIANGEIPVKELWINGERIK